MDFLRPLIAACLCHRASIDTNNDAGKKEAEALLSELVEKIETSCGNLKTQESYSLEKSLDFQGAMEDFQVRSAVF